MYCVGICHASMEHTHLLLWYSGKCGTDDIFLMEGGV